MPDSRYVWVKSFRRFFYYPRVSMCEVKVRAMRVTVSSLPGTNCSADFAPQVFTRESPPTLAYQGVSVDSTRYMRLTHGWTFWPGTVAMWIRATIPKAGELSGGNLVLLGSMSTSAGARG